MKYITLAAHNNELFVIKDMDAFATLFCYAKRLRHDQAGLVLPPDENPVDVDEPVPGRAIDDTEPADEDDI